MKQTMKYSQEEYEIIKERDMEFAKRIKFQIDHSTDQDAQYKEHRAIMDLRHMLQTSCSEELYGDRVCWWQKYDRNGEYQPILYKEVLERVNALGTKLVDLDLCDEKISVIGDNCSEWAVAYLAIICGTGVVVPLDKELSDDSIRSLTSRGHVKAVLFKHKHIDIFKELRDDPGSPVEVLIDLDADEDEDGVLSCKKLIEEGKKMVAAGDRRFLDAQIDAEALAAILFTSGTTAQPKGVMLSHKNLVTDIMVAPCVFKVYQSDIFFSVLPMHHAYECTCGFLIPIYCGAQTAYCEGLKYIRKNLQEIHPTIFLGVPAIFESLDKAIWKNIRKEGKEKTVRRIIALNKRTKKAKIDLGDIFFKDIRDVLGGRMRTLICGGAAINPMVLEDMKDFGIMALQGYGLTECAPMGALNPDKHAKSISIGKAFPSCDMKINDPDEDGMGEIWLKGDNIMMGYYEMPEETAEVLVDGWLRTGDIGFMDSTGYAVITGRAKNVIIAKNGKNVFPEEIENNLIDLPIVEESMVFSENTEDKEDIKIVASIIVDKEEIAMRLGEDASDEDIMKLLWEEVDKINEKQPFFKRIKEIKLRKEPFVKNTSKKIVRFAEENRK